jgi:hypothetical protein
LLVPFPLRVGTFWNSAPAPSYPLTWLFGFPLTCSVTGWENVEIPGAKYPNCLRIHGASENGLVEADAWYAAGVGLVKSEVRNRNGAKITRILREFKPGRKLTGVNKAPEPSRADGDANEYPYFPLQVGRETIMADVHGGPSSECTKVVGMVEKNGKIYFRSRLSWLIANAGEAALEANELLRKDGQALYAVDEGFHSVEQVKFALPLKAGQTGVRTRGARREDYSIIGMESIEISGKSYDKCWHIRTAVMENGRPSTIDSWEAPNVGTVRTTSTSSDGKTRTIELKEFKSGG